MYSKSARSVIQDAFSSYTYAFFLSGKAWDSGTEYTHPVYDNGHK
jgi:hypothetical protein